MIFPLLLFIFYSLIVCFWIQKSNIIVDKELPKTFLYGIFCIKLISGLIYSYIHQRYYGGGDTYLLFSESYLLGNSIISNPLHYLNLWLGNSPAPLSSENFVYPDWPFIKKDFGTYFLVHIHALPSLLSFGYYNVHNVFVVFLSLVGSINIYNAVKDKVDIPLPLLVFVCFLMPSTLFWTSGLHKDVWIYFGFSLILTGLSKLSFNFRTSIRNLVIGLLIIALFRNYLLALLFPVLIAFGITYSKPAEKSFQKFVLTFFVFFILIVIIDIIDNGLMLRQLSERQHEFLKETGTSKISDAVPWFPSLKGFLFYLPQALVNVMLRPFLWECHDFFQALAAVEIVFFWVLLITAIVFRKKASLSKPLILFMLFYAILNFFIIGLLVSNVGTIVRYRAIALFLTAITLLEMIDFSKIKFLLKIKQPT